MTLSFFDSIQSKTKLTLIKTQATHNSNQNSSCNSPNAKNCIRPIVPVHCSLGVCTAVEMVESMMTESNDNDVYKLRCTLLGHSMDVRGVSSGTTEGGKHFVVSGSRDKSAKVWMPTEDGLGFSEFQSCQGHTNFISCVHIIPPNDKHPTGLILSGSHDHTILAFELGKLQPVFRLIGHKGTVCSIGGTTDALIVSGSWDQTAKVWAEQNCIATLTGHEAAVWAVATVPGGSGHKILTGSADKDIRLWENYQAVRIFQGHTDCVRALVVAGEDEFFSGSNDATIRQWSISQGETLKVYYGHSNFIYNIALLPGGNGFVSVGEDRTLRVWRKHVSDQVLFHPATSVWAVATMPNGDIITGSSDGSVRVFTSAPERMGSPEILAAFEEEVSKSVVAAQQDLGGMKVSELPGPESLLIEGRSDGETKMVRDGDKVGCFSWSAAEMKWTKVGDVVGASGATQNTSGRVLHEGKEYDYVFTVDLDGQGTLKLPYNVTEDPWFAAQKFIHKNELSQLFLDQVANFIITNTKGMQLGTSTGSNFDDPFTGGNRYVPGSSSVGMQVGGGGLDPFTGSGAYTTSSVPRSSGSSAPAAKGSASSSELNNSSTGPCFPVKEFVRFSAAPNYDALKKKLVEFIGTLDSRVWNDRVELLLDIGRKPDWNETVDTVIRQCLISWPSDKVFPILDLLRLGVLDPIFAQQLNTSIHVTTEFSGKFLSKETPTNQMLSLRLLSNVFGPLTKDLMADRHVVVSQILNNLCKGKMNEIAVATLFLNYSIVVSDRLENNSNQNPLWLSSETQTELLMATTQLIEMVDEPEALFRLMVTIGNLVHGNSTMGSLFSSLGGDVILENYKQTALLPKIKNCSEQIQATLSQSLASVPGPSSKLI